MDVKKNISQRRLNRTQVHAQNLGLRMLISEIDGPDPRARPDIQDAMEDFFLGDWRHDEIPIKGEGEEMVLEICRE
jgi:hypothetical protein